jgi:HD superfamily phosphodiesterase
MKFEEYLNNLPELKILYENVKKDFISRGLVHHNWTHILRDVGRGILIGEAEGADMKIVLASILLHDIGRLFPEKGRDHHHVGASLAVGYLTNAGFTEEETKKVIHCIKSHDPRGLEEPRSLEARVVYDAGFLSETGTVGIARVFHFFFAEAGLNVKNLTRIGSGKRGPRKDFYTRAGEKLGKRALVRSRKYWRELDRELKEEELKIKEFVSEYEGD